MTQKEVKQLHFIGWPDKGIPNINEAYGAFLNMINYIETKKGNTPLVVHCSAGVGRTGTFIAIYTLYKEIVNQIQDTRRNVISFSVFNIVRKMKEMRLYLVQNLQQYCFIYNFIFNFLKYNNQ